MKIRICCLDYYGVADTKFRQAAEAFIASAELSPALVNGEPRLVEMYFRVFFGRQGEHYAAGVFPNWGDVRRSRREAGVVHAESAGRTVDVAS